MNSELYYVIEARKLETTILFSGNKKECHAYADKKRKEYRENFGNEAGITIDCFVQSEKEYKENIALKKRNDEIRAKHTAEEMKETIVVNGKEYFKVWYEANIGGK